MQMETRDGDLVARAQAGDHQAYGALVKQHSRRVFHLAYRITGNEQDAEDVEAGEKVAGIISDAIENDPDTEVKRAAVFALAEMPDREGIPLLIGLIEKHSNPVVRREAMFWLAESDDPRALDFIEKILNG